ncbi:mitochondrial import inner membrane translocase subunit tim54 [Polyrhizophydium stewartii]|uniref:Mitochondrial import inner membrane translocase subunit TIM54 n=1 Tax=Polyrhizophydium stewartii TaxID=2732419 RepID=A0ABR4N3X4_9FUNG|nr:mitochondrial import inner membrane translocase subunit tim54 [Polyrhizophydium stewartii]
MSSTGPGSASATAPAEPATPVAPSGSAATEVPAGAGARRLPFKLPSRNWLIFWSVTASIAGLAAFDKWQLRRVRRELAERASVVAEQPLSPDELPRKVVVYIEPTHWARYWFKEYVKPVFDAAALDYDLVEPSHTAKIQAAARDVLWKAREMHADQLAKEEAKRAKAAYRRTWSGAISSYFYVDNDQDNDALLPPGLRLPKYNPATGLVAVGPLAWRNMLLGLSAGNQTVPVTVTETVPVSKTGTAAGPADAGAASDAQASPEETTIVTKTVPSAHSEDNQIHPAVAFPPLGYITGKNQSGWSGFPKRIVGFFRQHVIAGQVGEEALKIVFENTRPFAHGVDERLGAEDLVALPKPPKKDERTEAEVTLDSLNGVAHELAELDKPTSSRLSVYA